MVDTNQVERLRNALSEVRANKEVFTTESLTQIVLALMERLRKAQTKKISDTASKPPGDEIRLVTVMFIDIVDATAMAQNMDNSDWKNIINTTHTRIARVVNQYDGQIGQYLGDGLLCFFGASHSRSDDATRAVSCALGIQESLKAFANDVFLLHGKEFATRIALSTGRLVVGMIGGEAKRELLALGPATNLASRLQGLAPVGGIVIDSNTYGRVRGSFIIDPQPPTKLKGFDEPIAYYHVLGRQIALSAQIATTKIVGLEIPFVNRHQEMATIKQALQSAQDNQRGERLLITSGVGLGKSRILHEVLMQAGEHTSETIVMVAQYERRNASYNLLRDMLLRACHLNEDSPAESVRQAVRDYVTNAWHDPQAEIAATVMAFMAGFGGDESPHVQPLLRGGQDGKHAGFGWVLRFLRNLVHQTPLLIIVDNLQWADNDSQALLTYLMTHLSDLPSLFLMATREDAAPNKHLPDMPTIALAPLSNKDTAKLIGDICAHVRRTPDMLVPLIQERAAGNPLFVLEFLGMLFDNRVFKPTGDGHWQWDIVQYEATASHLPDGLIGVLQARLDDLPPEARQVLQVAAVVGQTFWQNIVEEITGLNVAPILDTLIEREMIYANSESALEDERQYTFRHPLYRDVAYEMLPRTTREKHHRSVAEWLIVRIAGKSDYYRLLAEQFELATQYEAALFTYLEAVENRVTRGLMTEALDMIDNGLSLARNVPRDVALVVVCQLWVMRATLYNELLRYDEAIAASNTALQQLQEIPADQLVHVRVEATRMLGIAHRSQGDYSQAITALSQGFEIMPEDDAVQLASMLRSFGSLSLYMGLLDEALAYQQRSYEYARHTQHQTSITGATMQLGLILLEKGRPAEALGYFHDVLRINHERGYTHFKVGDLRNVGQVYDALMSYERSLAVYEEARDLQRSLGHADNLLNALHGLCLMCRGDIALGMAQVRDAAQGGHVDVYHQHLLQLTLVNALYHDGDYEACIAHGQALLDETTINPIMRGRIIFKIGQAQQMQGNHEGALASLEQALALEVEYGGRDVWRIHASLAEVYGDHPQAQAHRQRAGDILREWEASLSIHPDLQYVFRHNETVQALFEATGEQLN